MSAIKPAVTLAVCGHVDSGKSTTVGHLLYLLGDISEEEMAKIEAGSSAMGKGSFEYAWELDKSKAGRERGITIKCHSKYFNTTKVSELFVCFYDLHPRPIQCDGQGFV